MSTVATCKTVSELRDSIVSGPRAAGWAAKMVHKVPELPLVKDRAAFLAETAKGKVVLDIGCTGEISAKVRAAAKVYYGVDREAGDRVTAVDIDHQPDKIPVYPDVELILLSEVLEHLGNPGYLLMALRHLYPGKEVVVTVPNAGAYAGKGDCEVVHQDHVAWYSYTTLKTLVTRYQYTVKAACWYHGTPHKAEGLIMVLL
jgi:2-polyprenyl-3-methyl-5-hydroxy-6-metoxy-1,4-benzoquinol methylase